ncbi:MAG: twin-arginine translocation signal domain-containing protein, partial [bacterium]|nr:twin-arginine translocation signal domain-containing protein [bacterium]
METNGFSRRGVLGMAGIAAAAAVVGLPRDSAVAEGAKPVRRPGGKVLRFAHLTDSHVQPELRAGEGIAACLKHMMAQPEAVGMVMTGGDLIMDSFGQPRERTKTQWDLY